jgi:hypothetical protein
MPDMPGAVAVFDWIHDDAVFAKQYARARELQAELYADEIVAISDDGSNDTYIDDEGKTHVDTDVIARSKLRVDARKWVASKLLPKKYGDKAAVELSGGVSLGITEIAARIQTVSPLLAARFPKKG